MGSSECLITLQDMCPKIYSITSTGEQSASFCTTLPDNPGEFS